MANTRFGNFSELSQGKKPMTAEEAWAMLNQLGLLGQEFVPGAVSIRKVFEGKPREAVEELQDWFPGNAAYQNFISGKDQDWVRNALDLAIVGKPIAKGAKKAMEAIERMPKGGKEGYIRLKKPLEEITSKDIAESAGLNEAQLKEYNQYINKINTMLDYSKPYAIRERAKADADRIISKMDPQTKEAAASLNTVKSTKIHQRMNEYAPMKPKGFDDWPPEKRIEHLKKEFSGYSLNDIANVNLRDHRRAGVRPDQGPIFEDILVANDVTKALSDQAAKTAEEKQLARKADEKRLAEKAERKAAEQAAKEAKWKAEREAAAKAAEEKRLAKEAEERRIAEEAEKQRLAEEAEAKLAEERRLAEEAERKAQEEEFERQFREEEAYERNRYADSVGTALGREAAERDIDNWLFDKLVEAEHAPKPITTTQVEDMSTGILPLNNEVVSKGGHRNTYDHSRQFMDSELKQVPGIDRTGMSYGDDTDAFYDLYKAWRDNPGRENQAIYEIIKESKSKPSKVSKIAYDPYYNAGVVGDLNHKLWGSIKGLRHKGYSDEEIREKLKKQLDEYQGKLERFKARMPGSNNGAQFDYDGAYTRSFHALPSEEARALKALGVDTPEYDELERLGNFYRVFFPK